MREGCYVLLLLCVVSVSTFGIFSRPNPFTAHIRPPPKKHGALKLCPPGGSSFIDAFNLICPMRRRRRSVDDGAFSRERRSSSMEKIMEECCYFGCNFQDIFPICNPFS